MKLQTLYKNGQYKIVAVVSHLIVVGQDGRQYQRFGAGEIELAVGTVDEMAESDGILRHAA